MPEPLSADRRSEIQHLDLLAMMDPEDAAVVGRALADLLGEIDRLNAELAATRSDALDEAISSFHRMAILAPDSRRAPGLNFAIGALMAIRDHPAKPAAACLCPDGPGVHQVGCPARAGAAGTEG